MEEIITSRENAKIKYACKLSGSAAFRQAEKAFLAEGLKLCSALAKGAIIKVLFYTQRAIEKSPEIAALPGEHYLIEEHVADKLADVGTNQGIFAIFEMPCTGLETIKQGSRVLALEGVQDPGNVGTLLRSSAAFGFDAVILGHGCAGLWAPKTLRASMGAAVQVPVIETEELPAALAALRARGILCLAAALYHSEPLDTADVDFPGGVCIVIGSEGQGLTDAAIAACDKAIRIPMTDKVESLNAGIAGSILLWHFRGVGR